MDEHERQEDTAGEPLEEQARNQTGQQRIRVRVDERELSTTYANGFRPTATAEEVILDFGLNLLRPAGKKEGEPEILFRATDRVILNYYVAKRLAIALGHIVRRYEQEFGDLELDAAKRRSR
jgi:hypothetical protein